MAAYGWRDIKNGQEKGTGYRRVALLPLLSAGSIFISPAIFSMMLKASGFHHDLYLALAKNNLIQAYPHDEGYGWTSEHRIMEKATQFLSTPEGIRWQQMY
jgi:hypothetical protein